MKKYLSTMKEFSEEQEQDLILNLKTRFETNKAHYKQLDWNKIETKFKSNPKKLWILNEMEETGGEPSLLSYDSKNDEYIFTDFSKESPKGRRSLCYDREALESRKKFKPENSALEVASEMGTELLTEELYRELQQFGEFDTKTSSWLKTPDDIRKLGGAIFGDFRYGQVFIYHNGADSYYASRVFRGVLKI